MTDYELQKVNAERRRRGLPPLTRTQAESAVRSQSSSSSDPGFDMTHFLISYSTGIPMPSSAGLLGAAMHPQPPSPSYDSSPSYSAPEPSSSHDSSSSYDSGSSGDSGGGGGGGGGGE